MGLPSKLPPGMKPTFRLPLGISEQELANRHYVVIDTDVANPLEIIDYITSGGPGILSGIDYEVALTGKSIDEFKNAIQEHNLEATVNEVDSEDFNRSLTRKAAKAFGTAVIADVVILNTMFEFMQSLPETQGKLVELGIHLLVEGITMTYLFPIDKIFKRSMPELSENRERRELTNYVKGLIQEAPYFPK